MDQTPHYAHVLPDEQQTLLLKAALSPLPEAVTAWDEWKRNRPADRSQEATLAQRIRSDMDSCSQRLLPLVFRNLEPTGDLIALLFKNNYQRTLQHNRQLLDVAKHIIQSLENNGFETLLLKGLPLTLGYYNDPGARHSADVDLLVRDHQFRAVCAFLEQELQLVPEMKSSSFFFAGLYNVMHSQVFRGDFPFELDVHHSLFHEHLHDDKTDLFWQQRESVVLDGDFRVHTLAPTHLLFHVLAHARDPKPAIRWVADAVTICREAAHRINWQELLTLAERHRFTSLFRVMLPFLAHNFSAPVPGAILEQLQYMPEHPYEKQYFFVTGQVSRNPLVKAYRFFYRDWLQQRLYREQYPSFFSYIGRQKDRLIYRIWEGVKK